MRMGGVKERKWDLNLGHSNQLCVALPQGKIVVEDLCCLVLPFHGCVLLISMFTHRWWCSYIFFPTTLPPYATAGIWTHVSQSCTSLKDLCKKALPTELRQLWQDSYQNWFQRQCFKDLLSMNQSFGSFPRIPVLASAKALFKAKSALMAMCTGGSPVAFDPRTPRPSIQRSSHSNYLIQYFVHPEYLKCSASSLVPLGLIMR